MFKTVFSDILLEREFAGSVSCVRREQRYDLLPQKAPVVIGIRRSGKTAFDPQ